MTATTRRKRRPRGSGSLIERKPFWWVSLVHLGERLETSSRCTRRKDALDLLEKCRDAIRAGTFRSIEEVRDGVSSAPETVKAVADAWLDRYVRSVRDAKGYALAKRRMETYLAPFIGEKEAYRLTMDDLRDYRTMLQQRKVTRRRQDGTLVETADLLSTSSVRHILSDLRCMVLWAEERRLVQRGLVPKRRFLPKAPEQPLRSLVVEEQAAARAIEDPYGFAVRIMLDSGVRWSELCRLTRDDLQEGELVIHGMTKSRKMRTVPIPLALVNEIKTHVGKLVPFAQSDNPWFNRAVRERSGVEAFSAHRCRHSFGFNYAASGGNILVLRDLMGHSTVTVTEAYAKPTLDHVRRDAARVHRAQGA